MNKFFRTLYIVPLFFLLTGCWTRIWTVAPTTEYVAPERTVYTTRVTTPSPKVTTVQTVTVTSYNNDYSFYLDLNAVAAAFAESNSVREFEELLNSSRYMINNLDLNRDGWVDYLRVLETHRGYYHTLLIQACLGPGVFQDVATLIAERRSDRLYVEVVGDRWLYGYNYIVRPVFVRRPPLWDVFGRSAYAVWWSPYAYGAYPSYYTHPKPVYLSHYQAYVTTYMHNHHYCHHCDNPTVVFYNDYSSMTKDYNRHDYATEHPSDGFEQRVASVATASGTTISARNAGQLRAEIQSREGSSRMGSTSTTTSSASTQTTSSRTGATTATSSSSTTSSRTTGTSTTTNAPQRGGTTTTTTATSGRSTSTTTSSRTGATTATSSSSSTSSRTTTPSTSVQTRVNKSGTTRTTIKTTDASGRTTTGSRTSSPSRSSSTSTSSRSSGTSSRSGTTSTRR